MSLFRDLADLLLPAKCVICNRLPRSLCEECLSKILLHPRAVMRQGLSGYSLGVYRDELAEVINAFKERGHRNLGGLLGRELASRLAPNRAEVLVGAPSASNRGFVPAKLIAASVAITWGVGLSSLRIMPGAADQSKLHRNQRLSNLVGRMWSPTALTGKRVLLVDDVVTTGATLAEMARAVTVAGGQPIGFITVAETIPKTLTNL